MVVLNDIHIDIVDYISPATYADLAFKHMWAEFEWVNKVLNDMIQDDLEAPIKKLYEVKVAEEAEAEAEAAAVSASSLPSSAIPSTGPPTTDPSIIIPAALIPPKPNQAVISSGTVGRRPPVDKGKDLLRGESSRSPQLAPSYTSSWDNKPQTLNTKGRHQGGRPLTPTRLASLSKSWAQLFPTQPKGHTNNELSFIAPSMEDGLPVVPSEEDDFQKWMSIGKTL
ncbi:Coatomer subunit beta-1 [Acorus calamus]|uniref:Coatomer subunit beta-1 n=1 Tax=Acorus calamus TaxID=4465 RepID=A0AAV9E4E1_ACOCL|nr:Coatomer subunit beta-1 [Acorus calamus]